MGDKSTSTSPSLCIAHNPDDPIPWAIFRCAHDAFRTALSEMEYLLTQEEAWRKESFPTLWTRYQKFAQLHSDMEDYGLFPLLDKVSNKTFSHGGFWDEHQQEVKAAVKVDRAVDIARQSGNWTKVLDAYRSWQKQHIQHLEHEEDVWGPFFEKIACTHQERCQLIHQEVITPMDQHDHNLCLQFYSWIVRYLSTFGAIHQTPKDATMLFVRGLRSVCSAQQWARFMPAVHAVCDDSVWQILLAKHNIHSADPIASQFIGSGFVTTDHSKCATPADKDHDRRTQNDDRLSSSIGGTMAIVNKPSKSSYFYNLGQPALRMFQSFYGAELEPSIVHSPDFPPNPNQDNGLNHLTQEDNTSRRSSNSHDGATDIPNTSAKSKSMNDNKSSFPKPAITSSVVVSKEVRPSVWFGVNFQKSNFKYRGTYSTICIFHVSV